MAAMDDSSEHDVTELRAKIIRSLRAQGFRVGDELYEQTEKQQRQGRQGRLLLPSGHLCKEGLRGLHATAVAHRIERARKQLFRAEKRLLQSIASGHEVVPAEIRPRLVEISPDSEEELLFRYASLHWSIPVSSGYGRRLRFLVVDEYNGKLIGLVGLGDPVFSLAPRDQWIGWTPVDRRERLVNVMDAFVLGAVPPYSFLLCGKLVAMLAASDTVRGAFERKYGGAGALISGRTHDGRLALITTTSALGRSSVYNRLRFGNRLLYHSVGFTQGSGEFHFSNGLYGAIAEFAEKNCEATAKQERWGTGFRNRREVIRKCLRALGLPSEWIYHGVEREVFVVPLARNTREFLRGEQAALLWYQQSEAEMFEYFRDRWMLRRASWDNRYRTFIRDNFRLWPGS